MQDSSWQMTVRAVIRLSIMICAESENEKNQSNSGFAYHVANAAEALRLCRELTESGKADFFRGQSDSWPLLPSFLRRTSKEKMLARSQLEEFLEWANYVPQMIRYHGNALAQEAIAQHYGIPTLLLDITSDPEVAVFFAQQGTGRQPNSERVIYCFSAATLASLKQDAPVGIDVENLWRLETQKGFFLKVDSRKIASHLERIALKIFFKTSDGHIRAAESIYPSRKSGLEVAIDEWLYRYNVDSTMAQISQNIKYVAKTRRQTYPGVFSWRKFPSYGDGWEDNRAAWSLARVESVSIVDAPKIACINTVDVSNPMSAIETIAAQIARPILNAFLAGSLLEFRVDIPEIPAVKRHSIQTLLHRCWDGVRSFPYKGDEVISSIVRTASQLIGRAIKGDVVDDWYEILWGNVLTLEIAPYGGHISSGVVSKSSLQDAICLKSQTHMTSY
jgi:hypothetical protein